MSRNQIRSFEVFGDGSRKRSAIANSRGPRSKLPTSFSIGLPLRTNFSGVIAFPHRINLKNSEARTWTNRPRPTCPVSWMR